MNDRLVFVSTLAERAATARSPDSIRRFFIGKFPVDAANVPRCARLPFLQSKLSKAVGLEPPDSANWLEWMFRCEVCLLPVGPGIRAHRFVVETREKKYPIRPRANRVIRASENGKSKERFADDPGGVGWEIVQERSVCPCCARRLSD